MPEQSGWIPIKKKPIEVSAIRVCDSNLALLRKMTDVVGLTTSVNGKLEYVRVKTLEGTLTGKVGDWLIRGVEGELYPIKDSILRATYEAIDG